VLLWPAVDYKGVVGPGNWSAGHLLGLANWMIDGAFAAQPVATVLVVAVSLWWFRRRGVLALYLFPALALVVLFVFVHAAYWHQGVLFLAWVFALWQSFHRAARDRDAAIMTAAAVVLLVFQISASIRTLRLDAARPYSGSKAAAQYLLAHRIDGVFARGFSTPAVLPYLPYNPFVNVETSWYPWTDRAYALQDLSRVQRTAPRHVLVSLKFEKHRMPIRGYRIVARFPGHLFWKGDPVEDDSYVLLERAQPRFTPRARPSRSSPAAPIVDARVPPRRTELPNPPPDGTSPAQNREAGRASRARASPARSTAARG
jgi:hypothetical protein